MASRKPPPQGLRDILNDLNMKVETLVTDIRGHKERGIHGVINQIKEVKEKVHNLHEELRKKPTIEDHEKLEAGLVDLEKRISKIETQVFFYKWVPSALKYILGVIIALLTVYGFLEGLNFI